MSTLGAHGVRLLETVCGMNPAQWCQTYFILTAAGILAVSTLPQLRRVVVDYGARTSTGDQQPSEVKKEPKKVKESEEAKEADEDGVLLRFVKRLAARSQVPHSWFITFYVASIAASLFWAIQCVTSGPVLHVIASHQADAGESSMTLSQVVVVWLLFMLQVSRRLYEHLFIMPPSSSKMWVGHWLFGMSFYLCISIAIWVEGSNAILNGDLRLPPFKTLLALPAFAHAWVDQFWCHKYLAGLKKYSLPTEGRFRDIACAHYTEECIVYGSLAMAAAPEGQVSNRTLLCATILVVVNLGVTARGTRRWYIEKFGPENVARWAILPYIF